MPTNPDRAETTGAIAPTRGAGRVVVTGAASPLGQRVVRRLTEAGGAEVVGLDRRRAPEVEGVEGVKGVEVVDLRTADLKGWFTDARAVVHLASAFGPALDGDPEIVDGGDVLLGRRVLEAAADAGVAQLVVRSSAAVYGAWANNPVPLTEDAPLRPVPDLAYAVQLAEVERLVGEWRADDAARVAAVLRPATPVAPGYRSWLARALQAAAVWRGPGDDPAAQFLHLDDLAEAVVLALADRLDGTWNVAPEGWLTPSALVALRAGEPRVRLPAAAADRLSRLRFRLHLASTPPGVLPHARHPWVVASDRLRAAGWEPANSNEEAYVSAMPAGPLATLSPRRRQELALGAAGVTLLGAVGGAVTWLRRRSRRSRG